MSFSGFETLTTRGCDCEDDPLTLLAQQQSFVLHYGAVLTRTTPHTQALCAIVHRSLLTRVWFPAVLQVYLRQNRRMLTDARSRQKRDERKKRFCPAALNYKAGDVCQQVCERYPVFICTLRASAGTSVIYILHDNTFNDTNPQTGFRRAFKSLF